MPDQLPLFGSPPPEEATKAEAGRASKEASPRGADSDARLVADPSPTPFSLTAPPDGKVRAQVQPESVHALAAALPPELRMGTSSWSFSGWDGLIYEGAHTSTKLARGGIGAYAEHPFLRTVGLDRTFYGPMSEDHYRELADQAPSSFRFLVKAHEACTIRRFSEHPRYGADRGRTNRRYLNADYALEHVVTPTVRGLGSKLGVLLFQFPPQSLGRAFTFCERLNRFLGAIPPEVPVAVELRSADSFGAEYVEVLTRAGVSHSLVVHPSMPSVRRQWELTKAIGGPVVIRWMLAPNRSYAEAKKAFAPFDRIAAADDGTLRQIVEVVEQCAEARRPVTVIANNKAEGSSPLSLARLAAALAG